MKLPPRKPAKTDALKHLRKDKVMRAVIDRVGDLTSKKDLDLYQSLLRAIVGQQLSVKAAATIWSRFLALYGNFCPAPDQLLATPDLDLRSAGLSFQKAGYLKNIARFANEQSLDYKQLKKLSDEALIEYLTSIKGVGRWTVEMILMFNLNRPDVFPVDDLGIQTGICKMYSVKAKDKKSLLLKMNKVAEAWRPHRTLACMYIWKNKDSPQN